MLHDLYPRDFYAGNQTNSVGSGEGGFFGMIEILLRAGCFMAIIGLGAVLRRTGFF
jgi:hypothetical protein